MTERDELLTGTRASLSLLSQIGSSFVESKGKFLGVCHGTDSFHLVNRFDLGPSSVSDLHSLASSSQRPVFIAVGAVLNNFSANVHNPNGITCNMLDKNSKNSRTSLIG